MTTTVSPWDFERATPTAVQGVASAPVPVVSDAGARALAITGQELKESAQETDRYALHLDTLQAQDALNRLRARKEDLTYGPDNGFMRIKGGDVLKPTTDDSRPMMESYPARLQAVSDDIAKGLSPRARQMFGQRAAGEMLAYKTELAKHQLQQLEQWNTSVYKDTLGATVNEAARYSGQPDRLDMLADRAEKATRSFAASNGLAPDAMVVAARSNVYRAGIEDLISKNDGPGALALFGRVGKGLDGKDLIEVQRQLKTVEIGQIARHYVADLGVSETGRRDQVIKSFTDDGYSALDGAAIAANFFHESRFRTSTAINRRDGNDGSDSINMGQWNGARAQAFKQFAATNGLDEADPNTAIQYFKAELDGTIPASVSGLAPGLKAKFQAARTVEEKAAILSREFFKPRDVEGNAKVRAETARTFLTDYQKAKDPLVGAVNANAPAEGAPKPEGPPGFLDTRRMLIDAEQWRLEATRRAAADFANNPTQRSAVEQLINTQYEERKRVIEIAKLKLNDAVQDWVTMPGADGRPQTQRPPPQVWNQLTYQQQRSIDATLAHNAKGADAVTDQQVWYTIHRGLTSTDPQERQKWANEPLWQYKSKLSNSDFQELAKIQGSVTKGDPEKQVTHIMTAKGMVDQALQNMNIDPTPKQGSQDAEKAAAFHRRVQEDLSAFERTKGSKATPDEMQKIIDGLTRKVAGTDGWMGLGGYKRAFQMTIKDVPAADQAAIRESLGRMRPGRPVSDQDIVNIYARENAVKK